MQILLSRAANGGLVYASGRSSVPALGTARWKIVPQGLRGDAHSVPPCASIIDRQRCKCFGHRQIFHQAVHSEDQRKGRTLHSDREWAYARAYHNSDQRSAELLYWLHRYNWHRPHGGLKADTPISRLVLSEDNVLRLHNVSFQ